MGRLRRALEPGRARGAAGEVLVTRDPGYLPRVPPQALDAARFEELTAACLGHLPRGVDLVGKRVGNYQHNPMWGVVLSQLWVV